MTPNKFLVKMIKRYNLSQIHAAKLCGQSFSSISHYRRNTRSIKIDVLEVFMRNLAKLVNSQSDMIDYDLTDFEDLKYKLKYKSVNAS